MKSLNGVKADSWGMGQAIPRENSTITDSSIPDSFDSETNWPKCAKVIGDIATNLCVAAAGHSPALPLLRTVCASHPRARLLCLCQRRISASAPTPTDAKEVKSQLLGTTSPRPAP